MKLIRIALLFVLLRPGSAFALRQCEERDSEVNAAIPDVAGVYHGTGHFIGGMSGNERFDGEILLILAQDGESISGSWRGPLAGGPSGLRVVGVVEFGAIRLDLYSGKSLRYTSDAHLSRPDSSGKTRIIGEQWPVGYDDFSCSFSLEP